MVTLTFAQIGLLYNTMTDQLLGGVTPQNKQAILHEITGVQAGIQNLINTGVIGRLGDVSVVHAQNVVDQMNFLTQQVKLVGTDAFAPRFINDVVRDIQDIVLGDAGLKALASTNGVQGFETTSHLLAPPAPFPDTPLQTSTLLKFVADSNDLAGRATALAGTDPHSADVQQLVADIQHFSTAADAYSTAQGGLFSARFNNEFNLNGVQGTAARELVTGLQHGDAAMVNAAAEVLQANAADVRGNMLASGDTYTPPVNGGIPLNIDTIQVAGQVFNDAVTKLIGGVNPQTQASVVKDLNAVIDGLHNAIANEHITGQALNDVNKIVKILTQDVNLVQNTTLPQQVNQVAAQIHNDTVQVLNIVHNDATLSALSIADPNQATGFVALPVDTTHHYPVHF